MKKRIETLTKTCQHDLKQADKITFAQRMLLEAQESHFFYAENNVRKLLKEISPFKVEDLSKVCKEFSSTHEYFCFDIVRLFLKKVKERILAHGLKDTSYLDNVECIFMTGGTCFSGAADKECTAKEFCIEFIDVLSKKQFSVLFPVAENYYFKTIGDIQKVLDGTFKVFNLGHSYSIGDVLEYHMDAYHPCLCLTNDIDVLSRTIKEFLTTSNLDTKDVYSPFLSKFLEEYKPYRRDPLVPYWNESTNNNLWEEYAYEEDEDRTASYIDEKSIATILETLEKTYLDVQYKKVKVKKRL